jgi:hypothetical protein
MATIRILTGLAFSLAVAACGGGGAAGSSSNGNATVIAITAGNQKTVAGSTVDSDLRSFGSAGSDQVVGATDAAAPRRINFLRYVQANLAKEVPPSAGDESLPIGAVPASGESSCVAGDAGSGTVRVTYVDNGDDEISSGDSVSINYNNCLNPATNERTNGTVSYAISKVTGTPSSSSSGWSITASVLFVNFRVTANNGAGQTTTVNGRLTLTYSQDTANQTTSVIAGSNLTISDSTGLVTWINFSFTFVENDLTGEYRESGNGTVGNSALGGNVTITFTNVSGTDPEFPDSGSIKISGDKSSLTLRPQDNTNVRLELDLGDNGSIDATEIVAWSVLI